MARPGTLNRQIADRMLANARSLASNPDLVVPTCHGACPWRCTWAKARKDVLKVHAVRDDALALNKLGTKGHELARAYAGLLQLLHGPMPKHALPYATPVGTRMVLPRGRTTYPAVTSLQYHHEPKLRMLGIRGLVGKDPVVLTEAGTACIHDGAIPMDILDQWATANQATSVGERAWACPHVDAADHVEVKLEHGGGLQVCPSCTNGHALAPLFERIALARPSAHIHTVVHLRNAPAGAGHEAVDAAREDHAQHLRLRTTTLQLVEAARTRWMETLGDAKEPFVLAGREKHVPPWDTLLDGHHDAVGVVLKAGLHGLESGTAIDRASEAGLLVALWSHGARDAAEAVLGSNLPRTLARDEAAAVLDGLRQSSQEHAAQDGLPAARDLDHASQSLREALVIFRLVGAGAVVAESKRRPGRQRAAWLALAQAAGGKVETWQLSREDRTVLEALAPQAKIVMQAIEQSPDAVATALADLVRLGGLDEA